MRDAVDAQRIVLSGLKRLIDDERPLWRSSLRPGLASALDSLQVNADVSCWMSTLPQENTTSCRA